MFRLVGGWVVVFVLGMERLLYVLFVSCGRVNVMSDVVTVFVSGVVDIVICIDTALEAILNIFWQGYKDHGISYDVYW